MYLTFVWSPHAAPCWRPRPPQTDARPRSRNLDRLPTPRPRCSTRPTAWNPTTLAASAPARTFCATSTRSSIEMVPTGWPIVVHHRQTSHLSVTHPAKGLMRQLVDASRVRIPVPVRSQPRWSRRIPTRIAHGIGHDHAWVLTDSIGNRAVNPKLAESAPNSHGSPSSRGAPTAADTALDGWGYSPRQRVKPCRS